MNSQQRRIQRNKAVFAWGQSLRKMIIFIDTYRWGVGIVLLLLALVICAIAGMSLQELLNLALSLAPFIK